MEETLQGKNPTFKVRKVILNPLSHLSVVISVLLLFSFTKILIGPYVVKTLSFY